MTDKLKLYDAEVASRLLLGTSRYPSPAHLISAIRVCEAEVLTVSLRREAPGTKAGQKFWDMIRAEGKHILPNTAGCFSVKEAVVTAHMARDLFDTRWIKLEVIGDDYTLQPDPFGLIEAARILISEGFQVFPYMNDDLIVAEKLVEAGCKVLMPWGSPIGSGRGLANIWALSILRQRFPEVTLIVDAGIGRPSDAVQAMELGYDAVLLNTAVATASDPVAMAEAFSDAVNCGRKGYLAGIMERRESAVASTPVTGKANFTRPLQ